MADFVNFDQICLDLQAGVDAAPSKLGFATTFVDANDRDYVFQKAPLLDIRVSRMDPEQISNQTCY